MGRRLSLLFGLAVAAAVAVVAIVLIGGGSDTVAATSQPDEVAEPTDFEVTELADIDQLRQAFDSAEGQPRLILLVDPI